MVSAISGDELFGGGFVSAKAFGAQGDGTTDDTTALQDAIDYCFGSPSTPNGISYWLNKKLYFPGGKYKTTAPLLLTKLQGGVIQGSGRFTTTIENVTGGSGTGDVFRSNGMGYSSISDMQLICHEDGTCLDLDYDGEGDGAALQANTIENIFCLGSYESGTIGIRVGQSGFMGSECIFKMVHNQGCKLAGTLINNYNALQHQFYGGQDQACGIGIWVTVGSAPIISGRGFQQQVDCDIKISGGFHNCASITGCRTESSNFIINDGNQHLDIAACIQNAASEPGYFVLSGGMTSIRACESNGVVNPIGACKLNIETSWVGMSLDAAELNWIPNNDDLANIFIRNCWLNEFGDTTFIAEERRYTENGVDLLVATYIPGTYGPVVVSTGGGAATTTFDPANKSASITLSGGDLIATATGSTNNQVVRSVASRSTGKYYCEFKMTLKTGSDSDAVGLVNASYVIDAGGGYMGVNNNAIGYFDTTGAYLNNTSVGTAGTYTTADVICMAVDTTARLVWFRKNGGNWNNNGSADPATGALGIDVSGITGALFAAVCVGTTGSIWTANFGASAYAQTPPSGYGNW